MRATTMCVLALLGLFVGCASGDPNKPPETAAQQRETPSASGDGETAASPPPPADAGTATGHGADRRRVVVPAKDGTPPSAAVVLADASNGRTLGEAAQPGGTHSPIVELSQPRMRGTAIGEDRNGGMSKVRLSIAERIRCRAGDGSRFERMRIRYFPPPEIERISALPGARVPAERRRSRLLTLGGDRCGAGARPTQVHGTLWAQVINSHGLEAVTPHIRFVYRQR